MAVPRDEMNVLHAASELQTVAATSAEDAQKASIAYSLNNAANTGEYVVVWIGALLDSVKEAIEDEGYTIEPTKLHTGEPVKDSWTISFKPEDGSE